MDPLPDDLLDRALAAVAADPGPAAVADGRYRLDRVIGRGGSGTVWLAHDTHLDRPVAVKLLHPEAELSGEMVRRFRAEGRTAGRLQHPGIAPVYDLGTTPDGRPFLVLKLVSGQTLAEVFAARPAHAADRPALLALFASLCQAIAYAHADGVVHRDLKPGNVMVGRFGEVQVMDWGLSKRLRHVAGGVRNEDTPPGSVAGPGVTNLQPTDTRADSVLGTPAYMAPEQAGGAGAVDARADVFGLGAILCELLTGRPPRASGEYPTADRPLDPTALRQRLADADPPLADLVVRCLAADPADRPVDGGEVATAVTAYQAAVQERLAVAELAAHTARVEARERRRRRRLWAGLTVATGLVVAGGLWVAADRAARRQAEADDEREVMALLDTADRALAGGRRAEAEAAVRTADGRARDAAPAVRDRVAVRLADLRLLDRLADIRLLRGRADPAPVPGGIGRRDREGFVYDRAAGFYYQAAFRDRGLDPLAPGAADRIRGSTVAPAVVAALDAWAVNTPDPARRAELLAVAGAADPSPAGLPTRVRRAVATGDKEALAQAADSATPDQPPAALVTLARVLRGRGEAAKALTVLRPARDRHPGDFWLTLELAAAALAAGQPHDPWRTAAEALAGGTAEVDLYLGNAAADAGRMADAEAAFRRVRTAAPTLNAGRVRLGYALNAQAKYEEGRAELEAAVAADPNDSVAWFNLGAVRQLTPATRAAAETAYRRAVAIEPDYFEAWNNLGTTLTSLGRPADAEAALREAIRVRPGYARAEHNLGCLFDEQSRTADAEAAYRRAIAADPKHPEAHYNLTHDLVYMDGKFLEAGRLLATSKPFAPDPARWERLSTEAARLGTIDRTVDGPPPPDPAALRDWAYLAAWPHRRRYAAAADAYLQAFERDPKAAADLVYGYRYFAAGCAVRAAAGRGADSDPIRAAELRGRALGWLRADLALRAAAVRGPDPAKRDAARKALQYWLTDPNLTPVRDPSALPATEQDGWAAVWREVAELLASGP